MISSEDVCLSTNPASASILVGTKHKIEPRLPCLAAISGSNRGFANVALFRFPRAANQSAFRAILASQDHGAIIDSSFDQQQLPAIGHPTLMPHLPATVEDGEALPFVSIGALVVLAQHAAVKYEVNPGARDLGIADERAADFKDIPIPDPEIEFSVGGWQTGS